LTDKFLAFLDILRGNSGDELLVGEIKIKVLPALDRRFFGVLFAEELFDLVKILSERPSINSPTKLQSSSSVSAFALGQSADS